MADSIRPSIKLGSELQKICGIVMPISAADGYAASHWEDVRHILDEVIKNAGFEPRMVSDADEIGIIHNRIVTNLYENPIIVCDVSSKNPNVMFELGLRLAFDKATIIIKDDVTNYTFDTGVIEHLTYPKDLRYGTINSFKLKLRDKIISTYEASKDENYSTFLKNFSKYKAKLEVYEVSSQELILKKLEGLEKIINPVRTTISVVEEIDTPIMKVRDELEARLAFAFSKLILQTNFSQLPKNEFIERFIEYVTLVNPSYSRQFKDTPESLLRQISERLYAKHFSTQKPNSEID